MWKHCNRRSLLIATLSEYLYLLTCFSSRSALPVGGPHTYLVRLFAFDKQQTGNPIENVHCIVALIVALPRLSAFSPSAVIPCRPSLSLILSPPAPFAFSSSAPFSPPPFSLRSSPLLRRSRVFGHKYLFDHSLRDKHRANMISAHIHARRTKSGGHREESQSACMFNNSDRSYS